MDKTQMKPNSTKKRSLESHEESDSRRERKRLKLGKTEPRKETQPEETQFKKIMEFKNQGKKLIEKEKSKRSSWKPTEVEKMRRRRHEWNSDDYEEEGAES